MEGYRLRSKHGETIDGQLPLQTDSVEAQETVSVTPTLTYNGKAAAGAVSVSSVALKPIIESLGSRVASYWGKEQNLVYSALADGNPKKGASWLLTVTETATAAAITIYDPNKNLEEMFESVTGTVKRFVVKVYDKRGGTLYGWVRGVSVASDVYTFEIMNNRLTETQSWIGTLASFDNTSLDKVEIYFYNSSISFGTGTTFTEEVDCPKEYSKNRELQLRFAETLANGQYFVDYWRGELIGVKANSTASEVLTYNVWSSTVGGNSGPSSNVAVTASVYPVGLGLAGCGELQGSTSALQLPSLACKMVKFKASAANSGNVYLGGAGVTVPNATTDATTGMQLAPGDDSGWIPITNTNLLYRICDNATDALTFLALT